MKLFAIGLACVGFVSAGVPEHHNRYRRDNDRTVVYSMSGEETSDQLMEILLDISGTNTFITV